MKIIEQNAGPLTNFEVLDLLRSRGARMDTIRIVDFVAPSEFKVFEYLEQSPATNQTREMIQKFAEEGRKFDLSKAEILNIINLRPVSAVELYTIIEECDERMKDGVEGILDMISQTLAPPPS